MIINNEFGSNLLNVIKTLITGLVDFWNNYLNYTLFSINFNGIEYDISVMFLMTSLGLLILITMKVIDLVIPN